MVLNSTSSCEWFNARAAVAFPPHCSTLHARETPPSLTRTRLRQRARAGMKWGMTTTANASRTGRIKLSSGSTCRASSTTSTTPPSTAMSCTRPFPPPRTPAAAGSTITGPTRSATIRSSKSRASRAYTSLARATISVSVSTTRCANTRIRRGAKAPSRSPPPPSSPPPRALN